MIEGPEQTSGAHGVRRTSVGVVQTLTVLEALMSEMVAVRLQWIACRPKPQRLNRHPIRDVSRLDLQPARAFLNRRGPVQVSFAFVRYIP